ncbi:MAG: hypothetical protein IPN71_17475 [Fibrobacteres bacterium]|nr:hypothetical protein [Fibrobacterota bacterium]
MFSLYMHMKPVETPFQTGSIATDPQPLKGDLADIPWLRQVFLGQHGMFIKVRAKASWDGADSQPMGSCVWATEPYQPQACQATVISRDGKSVFKIGIRENTQDPQALWEFKSPALEIANLWSLLSEGKTVTFNHPFLTVQGNAVLGMVGPYSGKHSDIKDAKGVVKFKVSPTFLHWEVFSAQADSTVTSLVNLLVEKSGGALSEDFFPTILSATPEEAFADESISSKFGIKGALAGWADFPTKPVPYDLVKKYNDQASTGTKVDLGFDLGKMIPPSKLSPPQTEVIWKIEWVHSLDKGEVVLPPSYRIHLTDTEAWVDFTDSGDEGKFDKPPSRVALTSAHWSGKTLVNLVLCAPLLADLVRIDGEASSLTAASSAKEIGAVDFARFKALTGTSFRSTRLKFTSNWLPTSNQILLNSEAGKGIPPAALTWWDPAQESPGLNAASGADAKLFGSALPSDGTVETMNPITLKWILEMLSAMKDTLTFKQPSPDTKPDGKPSRGALKPVGAGILSKEATVAFGTELVLIVVDEMYALGNEGSTPATYELRLKFIPSPSSPSASATASASSGLQAAAQGGSIPTADSLKTTGIGMAKSEMTNAFGKAKQELTGSPLREGVMPVEFVDHLHVPVAVDDCGIFFDRRMADVWGECTLEVFSDEELMKTSPWGLAKINIDPPRFSEATASPEDHLPFPKTRCLGWVVPWSAPEIRSKFAGLVEVVILGGNGARTPTGFCVRAIAQPKESPSASFKTENQVKFDGEFVVGFTPGKTNGKLLTKDISWDSVKAAATTPRVHQALVLSLQDLFTHLGKPVKLSAIESDGLGCLMDGDCTVAATTTNLFSMIQLVDTRTRLRVVPANSHQLLFEFDPLPAILEAYDEDPKKVLDKDYSFDFHVVAGMSERIDALKEVKVFKLDQSRSPASIATYPCPEPLGHYGALGFGELQARLYAPSTATPSASQWHFELELAGNTDLWSRQILEATISFGVITGIPETQSVQTVGTVESGKVVFVAFQPAEGDFLRKGKHVLKVRARPRTEADGEKSPSGAIKEFSDSLLGPLVGTELECSRSIDLTAKLGAATTTRSAQGVQVAISTQGLLETLLPKEMASTEVDAFHCQFVAANGRTAPLPGPHSDGRTYPARDGNLHVQVPQVLLAAWGDGRVEVRGQNASHAGASFLSAQVPVGAASQGGAA